MRRSAKSRIGALLAVGITLAIVAFGVPDTLLARWNYAQERGRLRAASEELASVQEVSHAFRLVANVARPAVVQIRVQPDATGGEDFQKLADERTQLQHRSDELDARMDKAQADGSSTERRELRQEWNKLQREREALEEKARGLFERMQSNTGSGVVIDEQGHILTNNHVVERAGDITVRLNDDREYTGRLVGRDTKTDLAVVQIDAPQLHTLKLGNSEEMDVGDWVIAIGAPFGLSQTVTHGIISAKGRSDVQTEREILYQDFLQTDAAINPGNSGGPLLNLKGEVIGINTAIATNGESYNAGVAFTIPSNLARKIADKLIQTGTVARGWLGVSLADLTGEDLQVLGGRGQHGVMINTLYPEGPAAKAGLQCEDVLLSVNAAKVDSIRRLQAVIADTLPGETARLSILRDGQTLELPIEVARQPDDINSFVRRSREGAQTSRAVPQLALRGRTIRPSLGIKTRVAESPKNLVGVLVVDAPAETGLLPGEIILSADHKEVRSVGDLLRTLGSERKDAVQLEVLDQRLESTHTVKVPPVKPAEGAEKTGSDTN